MAQTNINATDPSALIAHLEEAAWKLNDCLFLFEQIQGQIDSDAAINNLTRIGKAIASAASDFALDAVDVARTNATVGA